MSRHFESLRTATPALADFGGWREGAVVNDQVPPEREVRAQRRVEAWNQALLAAVPWRAADLVVSGAYDPSWPAASLAQRWLDSPEAPHIMFRGVSRSGKTLASTLIVRHWLEPGMSRGGVRLLHPNALISAMLHDYDPQSPKIDDKVTLVVVDDIGRETKQAGLIEALCLLLDRRNLRVVMSTNLSKAAFREVYAEPRLLERLRESTYAADVRPVGERRPSGDF